jgi:hypothetical protein
VSVEHLIGELREVCAGLPDQRKGPRHDGDYTMADIGLAAFSIFFMGSPSFLGHQRTLAEGHGRSNCQTLFGMSAIPSDNYIRAMLDGATPAEFDALFIKAIEAAGPLTPFQCLDGRMLIALDGTEHFCSRKITCQQCSTRRRSDGGTEYFHAFLAASLVAPGHKQVLPLPPEFIAPQDGAEKQDCERNAAKRWLARHGASFARLRPVYLGDDLFACQPVAEAITAAGGDFLLTAKPSSHKALYDFMDGAVVEEHTVKQKAGSKRLTYRYRWFEQAPLREGRDAMLVNWAGVTITDAKGKVTYDNAFVTSLPVTEGTVAEIVACARARWKVENEGFNVLKSNGYHLEHNFGHGKQNLAKLFAAMNLLAFAIHTVCDCLEQAWIDARTAKRARKRFFEHIRTITAYLVFPDWQTLMQTLIASKPPPDIAAQIAM